MPVTVFTAKVVGTVSIGLWAGYNLSFVQQDMLSSQLQAPVRWFEQQLLSHCSRKSHDGEDASDASSDTTDTNRAREQPFHAANALASLSRSLGASVIAGIVCAANVTAYTFSNRASKHPYLLYIALGAPLVGALQLFGAKELRSQIRSSSSTSAEEASELSESTYEHVSAPGDTLSPSVTPQQGPPRVTLQSKYAIYSAAVASLSTLLCTISVIGLAGDTTVRF